MKKIIQFSTFVLAMCIVNSASTQILDGTFEAGFGGGAWIEASTNFGTPLCNWASCGDCGGPCVSYSGSFYVWFGGSATLEVGSVEQSAMIPNGTTASIDMMVKIVFPGTAMAANKMDVFVDGNVMTTVTALDSSDYIDYTTLSVDVSGMADGGMHSIKIEGTENPGGFSILVDDVVLSVDGAVIGLFEKFTEPTFTVSPNPATETLNLTFGELSGEVLVSIVSINGTLVSQENLTDVFNKNFAFNTAEMQNGVYIVEVINDGKRTTQRVVVTK